VSPIIFNIFKEGDKKYGSRGWSSMSVKSLVAVCIINLRAEGFPSELTDKESEEKGYVI
jgi:3-hydroxyisobutyrate dehydrogenase